MLLNLEGAADPLGFANLHDYLDVLIIPLSVALLGVLWPFFAARQRRKNFEDLIRRELEEARPADLGADVPWHAHLHRRFLHEEIIGHPRENTDFILSLAPELSYHLAQMWTEFGKAESASAMGRSARMHGEEFCWHLEQTAVYLDRHRRWRDRRDESKLLKPVSQAWWIQVRKDHRGDLVTRTIVVCADGTAGTFKDQSNVVRMIECLDLTDETRQVVVYDQGLGTAEPVARNLTDAPALRVLRSDRRQGRLARLLGLAFGYGLKTNVKQLWCTIVKLRPVDSDELVLLGFSRGAFTVRAIAGILHRCGIPESSYDLDRAFAAAWRRYRPMRPRGPRGHVTSDRRPTIAFLGLFDTVKSYGGVVPRMLPHLRHNPDVVHVRHALALDERRAWFQATTWGWLDQDQTERAAASRLDPATKNTLSRQDVLEVWFTGSHIDIGAGGITLRWMLSECANSCDHIRLSEHGIEIASTQEPAEIPDVTASWTRPWRWSEWVPRLTIVNSGKWPRRRPTIGHHDGRRRPETLTRKGAVWAHATASLQTPVERVSTQPIRLSRA